MKPPKHFTFYVGRNLCEAEERTNGNYYVTYLNNHQNALGNYEQSRSNVILYLLDDYWVIKTIIEN